MKAERSVWLGALAIGLGAAVAYHNSFGGPFVFDDLPSILDNPSIRNLATAWSPPAGWGFTVSGRPLLNFSLALNYAVGGTGVWSYHALNWGIHVAAGLVLFGVVRRTVARISTNERRAQAIPPYSDTSAWFAAVVALLWTVHPLQTESVTYVIQRAESLMGLFYLLTLYGFVRAVEAVRPARWLALSVGACLLGVGSKEVIVTAPVVVFLYDRTFVEGSFVAAWRARWKYYVALAATWGPLAALVLATGGDRGGTFAYTPEAFAAYWLTQGEAVLRYLQLSVWPAPLVFDYGPAVERSVAVSVAWGVPVVGLLGLTGWALVRRPVAGFFGATFFLVLAPTSVVPGITQVIVEHRMYLPLAAVVAGLLGLAVNRLGPRALVAGGALVVVATALTIARNADYRDELTLWQDTLAKRPENPRAHNNLGSIYFNRGEWVKALGYFEEAVRLQPTLAQNHFNRGQALQEVGRLEEAVVAYREAVRLLSYFAQADLKLGMVLLKLGRPAEALEPVAKAAGRLVEPAEAYYVLGQAYFELGRVGESLASYERALAARPEWADAQFNRGLALVAAGRRDEAAKAYAAAIALAPKHALARLNLGVLLAERGDLTSAFAQLTAAVEAEPTLTEGHANRGNVLLELGRPEEAVESYRRALALRPDYALARFNLGNALLQLRRWSEAKREFAEVVRVRPDLDAARAMLERLQAVP